MMRVDQMGKFMGDDIVDARHGRTNEVRIEGYSSAPAPASPAARHEPKYWDRRLASQFDEPWRNRAEALRDANSPLLAIPARHQSLYHAGLAVFR
jgi:hypothetical protein